MPPPSAIDSPAMPPVSVAKCTPGPRGTYPLGAERAGPSGERRGGCGETPGSDRLGEHQHAGMADARRESAQRGEAPLRVEIAEFAEHGRTAAEDAELLILQLGQR